ncbi:MAG TPA: hypothetical protein VF175_16075 [Lacipirellula sp.]
MFVGRVKDTFHLSDRGLVIVLDVTYEKLPHEFRLKVGDEVEFGAVATERFRSTVTGIEILDPWSPQNLFGFLVPLDIKNRVLPGLEVWTL